jgi:tripartite motif-containing protein 71
MENQNTMAVTVTLLFHLYASFDAPGGIAVTHDGDLVVADMQSNKVVIVTLTGQVVRTIGTPQTFNRPRGVAVDIHGDIWIADSGNNGLQVFTETGRFVRSIYVLQPLAVAFLSNGKVVVATSYDGVYVLPPKGQRIQPFVTIENGERFVPIDVKVSSSDEIFVADSSNNRVQVFSADGILQRSFGGNREDMNYPTGIALASDGRVIVVEHQGDRISVWSSTGERIHQWGTREHQWGPIYKGDDKFYAPCCAAILPDGRVAVTDQGNERIKILSIVLPSLVQISPDSGQLSSSLL